MIFADTAYFIALLSPKDEWHEAAVRESRKLRRRLVSSVWILMELGDGVADTPNRTWFPEFVADLMGSAQFEIVPADAGHGAEGAAVAGVSQDREGVAPARTKLVGRGMFSVPMVAADKERRFAIADQSPRGARSHSWTRGGFPSAIIPWHKRCPRKECSLSRGVVGWAIANRPSVSRHVEGQVGRVVGGGEGAGGQR